MLALNSRQLSLLLFVVWPEPYLQLLLALAQQWKGLNIGGAWRIIMPRLTLARAAARAPPVGARARDYVTGHARATWAIL